MKTFKNKSLNIFIIFLFISLSIFGQEKNWYSCYDFFEYKHRLSIGTRNNGIGFGSYNKYNGINFNIRDNTCILNGIGVCVIGHLNTNKKTNGIEVGLFPNISEANGICIGVIMGGVRHTLNGISLMGLIGDVWKLNGINFTSGIFLNNEINGLSISGLSSISSIHNGVGISILIQRIDNLANGIFISGLFFNSEKTNGISIAPISINQSGNGLQIGVFNYSNQFNGIQFGLINILKENRRAFQILPIVNFNFKSDPPLTFEKDTILDLYGDTLKYIETYFPNGNIKSITITNGINQFGNHIEYYINGQIKNESYFVNGKINGPVKSYYKNGQLISEIQYSNGVPIGTYWVYNRKGKIIEERDAKLKYNKKGKIIPPLKLDSIDKF